jgi:hypothetical protein
VRSSGSPCRRCKAGALILCEGQHHRHGSGHGGTVKAIAIMQVRCQPNIGFGFCAAQKCGGLPVSSFATRAEELWSRTDGNARWLLQAKLIARIALRR